jgi:hypothetical protein
VPYVACADIGALVAIAFTRPRELWGTEINAVGDFVSGFEIADTLGRLRGQSFRYSAPPIWLMWIFAREFYTMRRMFERYGRPPYPSEVATFIDETRRLSPNVMTVERFLQEQQRVKPPIVHGV